ncbi:ABC-type branched-subunit amino acid transport system substrate-binding protein [Paraburkholderia sp. BL18I3N2]|uniref:branched-chain amino acid ABC transporter substrate-binding protein n=1 Tax=Paraburkholderia sp. BL18I3N2 TaxID=1938799 RepID=UPI000D07080F|nr:branched-chain amino acid ABC transporter substrate-binding protein [Paraburkholderia sp. BL18I3N2]PRX21646.1 ABC-type branched-subunit amino acid transport system substrate-binding protein [Paraburkholderia sp. BL18I3N2]
MKKFAVIAAALAISNVGLAHADTIDVKIGNSGPLTGNGAVAGKDAENGLRLAIDELNAKGVTIGGKKANFILDSQDDQGDPRVGVQVAQKLVDDHVDAVMGPFYSGVTLAAATVYGPSKIPVITSATNPAVTRQGMTNLFQVLPSDSRLGGEMARYAVASLKAKKAAIIDDRTAYGGGVADEFEKVVRQSGVDIVDREYTNDKATDFKAILTKIRATMPDVVFFGGYSQQAGLLVKQMHGLGIKALLLGGDAICNPDTGSIGGEQSASVRCPIGGSPLAGTSLTGKFHDAYVAKFKAQPQIYSAVFYDAMNMVAAAMQKAGSTKSDVVVKQLRDTDYTGIVGQYSFTSSGELKSPTVTIYKFAGSKLQVAN